MSVTPPKGRVRIEGPCHEGREVGKRKIRGGHTLKGIRLSPDRCCKMGPILVVSGIESTPFKTRTGVGREKLMLRGEKFSMGKNRDIQY